MSDKDELNFYRELMVETKGLQPRKVKAKQLWAEYQNQLAKMRSSK